MPPSANSTKWSQDRKAGDETVRTRRSGRSGRRAREDRTAYLAGSLCTGEETLCDRRTVREALAGRTGGRPEIEHADGSITPLWADDWRRLRPGDASLIDRCSGPTLDVGSGPGRLAVALAERGVPTLGIDVAPHAVSVARSAGSLTLLRDVFSRVPGTGRWKIVLLADGNIGIGGDPSRCCAGWPSCSAPPGGAGRGPAAGPRQRSERVRLRAAARRRLVPLGPGRRGPAVRDRRRGRPAGGRDLVLRRPLVHRAAAAQRLN